MNTIAFVDTEVDPYSKKVQDIGNRSGSEDCVAGDFICKGFKEFLTI